MIDGTPFAADFGTAPSERRTPSRLRAFTPQPSVLLIGASTGGPQALNALMERLAPAVDLVPVCVSLHMPPDLVPVVATHLARSCRVRTEVVRSQQDLRPGIVYFGPGDRHVSFEQAKLGARSIRPTGETLRYFCKPAVDVMFSSAAACFGAASLAVVLSGMGNDGLAGARAIVAAGGTVLVQDKKSSAVWGMPGAVDKAELSAAALPPAELAMEIKCRLRQVGVRP